MMFPKAVENGKQEMLLAFPARSGDVPTVDEEEEMKGRWRTENRWFNRQAKSLSEMMAFKLKL